MTWWNDALARYGPVGFGLGAGTLAKQGLVLSDGGSISWKSLIADLLLLGFLGVIAVNVSDYFHLSGKESVLVGALAAVSSDRLVRMVRKRFEQRVTAEMDRHVPVPPSEAAKTLIGGPLPAPEPEMDGLIEQIDAADALLPKK